MLEKQQIPVEAIRVPVKRARDLDAARVEALAEDILENGQTAPIRVRVDPANPGHYILVEGMHRLEAIKALGEETITGVEVQARVR